MIDSSKHSSAPKAGSSMSNESWKLKVEDSVESRPFALVDDIVVIVRTPRSDDFVTVEIGPVDDSHLHPVLAPGIGVARASRPIPWVAKGWCGEMHVGPDEAVIFELSGRTYRLTLERIDHTRCRLPWGSYEFLLERETSLRSGRRAS
jgi:hypothetical protein